MKLPDVKYAIPAEILRDTVTSLEFATIRYEQEAAALLDTARHAQDETLAKLSRKLGRTRLEQADRTANLVDFYLSL